jgi:hypothetical protein
MPQDRTFFIPPMRTPTARAFLPLLPGRGRGIRKDGPPRKRKRNLGREAKAEGEMDQTPGPAEERPPPPFPGGRTRQSLNSTG